MKDKPMERVPQDLWQLIAKRLSQKDRSSARAASRFFFKKMAPEWDRYSRECRKIRAIAGGYSHSLLLTETGELFGCGDNNSGQLGLEQPQNQASWIPLIDKANIRAIAAGYSHSLLLTEMGELFGCGYNGSGQLGLGHTQNQTTWVKLNSFPKSSLSFDELCHQRHLAFLPVSLKTVLKQFEGLFQQLALEADKENHFALFSATKSSLQQQLTEPLPAPWDQEFEQLSLTEFRDFYLRLRAHCKLAPAEIQSSSKCLVM